MASAGQRRYGDVRRCRQDSRGDHGGRGGVAGGRQGDASRWRRRLGARDAPGGRRPGGAADRSCHGRPILGTSRHAVEPRARPVRRAGRAPGRRDGGRARRRRCRRSLGRRAQAGRGGGACRVPGRGRTAGRASAGDRRGRGAALRGAARMPGRRSRRELLGTRRAGCGGVRARHACRRAHPGGRRGLGRDPRRERARRRLRLHRSHPGGGDGRPGRALPFGVAPPRPPGRRGVGRGERIGRGARGSPRPRRGRARLPGRGVARAARRGSCAICTSPPCSTTSGRSARRPA